MTDGKHRDVDRHVTHPIEKENHSEQVEQMIVARDHVLRTEIRKHGQRQSAVLLEVSRIAIGNAVGQEQARKQYQYCRKNARQP